MHTYKCTYVDIYSSARPGTLRYTSYPASSCSDLKICFCGHVEFILDQQNWGSNVGPKQIGFQCDLENG